MTTIAMIITGQLRARWRSWGALAILVGLAGTIVLTAAAGARRTDTAYQRFLEASSAANVLVSPNNTGFGGYYGALNKLPGVETVGPVIGIQSLPYFPRRGFPKIVEAQVFAPADDRMGNQIERPRVAVGRFPNPRRADEVAVDLAAARVLHVGVGGTVRLVASTSSATLW